jgi:cytoskeleton protein RodZ
MNSEIFNEGSENANRETNSIGQKLRRAREALRLTTIDIARQLRLHEDRITALENDDYQNMPGVTFVKGYLRAYAQMVNLSGDEIIADFERLNLMPESSRSYMLNLKKQPVSLKDKPVRWLIYIISLSLFVLVAIWWNTLSHTDSNLTLSSNQQSLKTNSTNKVASPAPAAPQAATTAATSATLPTTSPPPTTPTTTPTMTPATTMASQQTSNVANVEKNNDAPNLESKADQQSTDEPKPKSKPKSVKKARHAPEWFDDYDDDE